LTNLIQLNRGATGKRAQAKAAAQLGAEFIEAVWARHLPSLQRLVLPDSPAAMQLELFGDELFRVGLRLNDPREKGQLAPFEFQAEGEIGLLEVGVLEPLTEGEGHFRSLLGSSLLLRLQPGDSWLVEELIPVNTGKGFNPDDPADAIILEVYQGKRALPLQTANLDPVEQLFLASMPAQDGRFNIQELLNAVRLWRDFKGKKPDYKPGKAHIWAAAVEYLINLYDYFKAEEAEIARHYSTTTPAMLRRVRELAQTLNATQFDDRYSIHPDPIAHYREVFAEIGGRFNQEEMAKAARQFQEVFNTIEVPPDDVDFFGPS
jgi:hypothetical protein